MSHETFGDISEQFDFEEEGMMYVDAPLAGWLRRKRDGARFVYDCREIIPGKLWHWTLMPSPEGEDDPEKALAIAARAKSGSWISITEDRRTSPTSECRLATISYEFVAPVLGMARRTSRSNTDV